MIVIGFDVSSTCVGYGVLNIINNNITYIDSGYFLPLKSDSIIENLYDLKSNVNRLLLKYNPTHIGIEELIKFMKGSSSADTTLILSAFNRTVGLTAYEYTLANNLDKPQFFSVLSIRSKLKFENRLEKKEMPEAVAKHLDMQFPYEYNKRKTLLVYNYDRADGIAVALYYSFLLTNRFKIKKKK